MTTLAGKDGPRGMSFWKRGLPEKLHPLADPFVEVERREAGRLINDELLLLAGEISLTGRPLLPRGPDARGSRAPARLAGGLDVTAAKASSGDLAAAVDPSRFLVRGRPVCHHVRPFFCGMDHLLATMARVRPLFGRRWRRSSRSRTGRRESEAAIARHRSRRLRSRS